MTAENRKALEELSKNLKTLSMALEPFATLDDLPLEVKSRIEDLIQ